MGSVWDEENLAFMDTNALGMAANPFLQKQLAAGHSARSLGYALDAAQKASLDKLINNDFKGLGGGGDAGQDVGWWGEGGKLGTIFSGINALGSLWGGYQQGKAMEERNKLFGQDLEHRKAMDLENLANLRVTTQNELERNAFNAAQLGANVPVMGLPQSQLLPNQDFSKLKNLNTVA